MTQIRYLTPRRLLVDALWTVVPLVLGIGVIVIGRALARWLGLPDLAIAGTLGGMALAGLGPLRIFRRLLFPALDLRALLLRVLTDDPGRAWLGVCVVLAALVLALAGSSARADEVPPLARQYLPLLQAEQRDHWPGMPMPSALAAQVEQETCISLRHSRCWSPRAQLRTSREQGVGLGQITRAFRADGSTRFDSLAEMRQQFRAQLAGWRWDDSSLYDPALQLRALVLMDRRNWLAIDGTASDVDRLAMSLASYNGGLRGLAADRALCDGTPACDSGRWTGHVETTCSKATTAASGYGRSFCEINREYPRLILGPRRAKYIPLMES